MNVKNAIIAQYWASATTAEDFLGVVAWDGEAVGRRPESKRVYLFLVPVAEAPAFCADCTKVERCSPENGGGLHLRLVTGKVAKWMRDHNVQKYPVGVSCADFENDGKTWVETMKQAGHGDANFGWFAEKLIADLVGMVDYSPLYRNYRAEAEADIEAGANWKIPHALIEVKVCIGTHAGQVGYLED